MSIFVLNWLDLLSVFLVVVSRNSACFGARLRGLPLGDSQSGDEENKDSNEQCAPEENGGRFIIHVALPWNIVWCP